MQSHAHLIEASYSAMISEWFIKVSTTLCFEGFQEIVILPHRITGDVLHALPMSLGGLCTVRGK